MTYHHKHFPSLKRVAQYNAENHDSELDCADIVIHILDCMVDKYFNFVYGIEDKVYNLKLSMSMTAIVRALWKMSFNYVRI